MNPRVLYWPSSEPSPVLTPSEIEMLFDTCFQLAEAGMLNGAFKHASMPLFWCRLKTRGLNDLP